MTKAEIRELEAELNRLEDLQVEKLVDKKTANVGKVHKRIVKIRKILQTEKGDK